MVLSAWCCSCGDRVKPQINNIKPRTKNQEPRKKHFHFYKFQLISDTTNILVFSLGRHGSVITYATEILQHLPDDARWSVWTSSYCAEKQPSVGRKMMPTYGSLVGFVLATFFRLPVLLWKVFWAHRAEKYTAFYFPYSHAWDYFLVLLARFLGIETVVTVHDGVMHAGEVDKVQQFLIKRTIKGADKLIFLTHFVENLVKERFAVQQTPSFVIPHGLLSPDDLKSEVRTLSVRPKLLFLGRIGQYKGMELLVEAVQKLDSSLYDKLTIAGKLLYTPSISMEDTDKVFWQTGWLEETTVSELINTHDILILPYVEATQSGVIALGISACLPMIVSDVGGLREQFYSDYPLLISPDKQQLSMAIESLLQSPDLYKKISTDLHEWRNSLQWEQIAKQVLDVITKS